MHRKAGLSSALGTLSVAVCLGFLRAAESTACHDGIDGDCPIADVRADLYHGMPNTARATKKGECAAPESTFQNARKPQSWGGVPSAVSLFEKEWKPAPSESDPMR